MSVDSGNGVKPGFVPFQRPRPTAADQDRKLREVAELYQRQFMQEMVKAMRGTVQESGLVKVSQAEKIYREQLDQNYVENWSKKGGVGLADLIYQQLVEKIGPQMGLRKEISKPQGPIPLDASSNFTGMIKATQNGPKTSIHYQLDLQTGPQSTQSIQVKAPWSGTLLGTQKLESDEYLLEMLHDNGIKSQFVFRGKTLHDLGQGPIQEGQNIGLLSLEARNFFWNVEPPRVSYQTSLPDGQTLE